MRTVYLPGLILSLVCLTGLTYGQEGETPDILHAGSGQMTWTNINPALYYTVEWRNTLTTGEWSSIYSWFRDIQSQDGVISREIPAFFQIRSHDTPEYLRSLTATSSVLQAGYYAATNLALVNPNLMAENIRAGVTIFGVTGTYSESVEIPDSDYLVIDLSAGPDAENYPISSLDAVPIDGWTDEYKTTNMVFRRIPAGAFIMGSPTNELGRFPEETQHQVTLTQDFYIGVFPVTQWQWERVMGDWPSYFTNTTHRNARPVEQVSYNMIRGSDEGSGWPTNSNVDATSFMGRLRSRTGWAFDLPTESQWEYACRAGTTNALNSGKNLTTFLHPCPNMAEVGRYSRNHPGGYSDSSSAGTEGGTAKVGSYQPNNWGLYDMHGNVWEWVLDWHGDYGAEGGTYRQSRGGSWYVGARYCRSAYRSGGFHPNEAVSTYGFRVALPSAAAP